LDHPGNETAKYRRVPRPIQQDFGIGFLPAHRERIFDPFERLHPSYTYPGTGIGLAIVRKGVERMGGRTGANSEPGKGSEFWIELPKG
jgi:signal transduction histidine kinase